jgi:hypothetical protein
MRIPLTGQTDRDDVIIIIIHNPKPHSPTARWAHGWAGLVLVPVPAARRLLRQDTDDRVTTGSEEEANQEGDACTLMASVGCNETSSNRMLSVCALSPPMSISESLRVATRVALPPGQAA